MSPFIDPRQPGDASISSLVGQLRDDAGRAARAEVNLLKLRAGASVVQARSAAILLGAALLLALGAVIALVVGAVLTLATLVGPGWATLIVVAATLGLAGLLGWLGASRISAAIALWSTR